MVADPDTVNKMLNAQDFNRHERLRLPGHDLSSSGDESKFIHLNSCSGDCKQDHRPEGAPDEPELKRYELHLGKRYNLHLGGPRPVLWGSGGQLPPDLPHYIRQGILMRNMSSYLVFLLKPSAQALFRTSKLLVLRCDQLFANRIRSRP